MSLQKQVGPVCAYSQTFITTSSNTDNSWIALWANRVLEGKKWSIVRGHPAARVLVHPPHSSHPRASFSGPSQLWPEAGIWFTIYWQTDFWQWSRNLQGILGKLTKIASVLRDFIFCNIFHCVYHFSTFRSYVSRSNQEGCLHSLH